MNETKLTMDNLDLRLKLLELKIIELEKENQILIDELIYQGDLMEYIFDICEKNFEEVYLYEYDESILDDEDEFEENYDEDDLSDYDITPEKFKAVIESIIRLREEEK